LAKVGNPPTEPITARICERQVWGRKSRSRREA
jgi:hypothetical protein